MAFFDAVAWVFGVGSLICILCACWWWVDTNKKLQLKPTDRQRLLNKLEIDPNPLIILILSILWLIFGGK